MAVLDESIANIALPVIAHEFRISPASSVWIISAYQIAITMAILPLSAVGDIIGHRRVYLAGLTLFLVASLSCVAASDLTQLAAARFVQGLGAAAIMAVNGALVRFTYPRDKLGRGISYSAIVVAICFSAGPLLAAGILSIGSWRGLFAINLPLGIAALVIGARALPDPRRALHSFDRVGAVLCATAFGAFFFGLAQFAHAGFSIPTVASLIGGLVAGWLTVERSRGREHPLIPLDLLAIPPLRLSYLISITGFAAHVSLLITLPYFLVEQLKFDHAAVGVVIAPLSLAVIIGAPMASRALDHFAASLVCATGVTVLAAGVLILALSPRDMAGIWLAAVMALCGLGLGLFQTPNNRTMIALTPQARSGVGSGTTAIARLIGQTGASVAVAMLFNLRGAGTRAPLYFAAAMALVAAAMSLRRRWLVDDLPD